MYNMNRREVVHWLWDICTLFRQSRNTVFRTLDFLDLYNYSAPLVRVSACFLISSKIEEHDFKHIPRPSDLTRLSKRCFTTSYLLKEERAILQDLDWKIISKILMDYISLEDMSLETLLTECCTLTKFYRIYNFQDIATTIQGLARSLLNHTPLRSYNERALLYQIKDIPNEYLKSIREHNTSTFDIVFVTNHNLNMDSSQ